MLRGKKNCDCECVKTDFNKNFFFLRERRGGGLESINSLKKRKSINSLKKTKHINSFLCGGEKKKTEIVGKESGIKTEKVTTYILNRIRRSLTLSYFCCFANVCILIAHSQTNKRNTNKWLGSYSFLRSISYFNSFCLKILKYSFESFLILLFQSTQPFVNGQKKPKFLFIWEF